MGLFDGFEAGWNSFKNNEGKKIIDTITKPNPLIQIATGNADNILSDKSAAEQWDEVKNSDLVKDPVNTVTNTVTNVTKEVSNTVEKYVIEPAQNVVKGVGEALPIIAIGGGAILVLSVLLGRR